MNAVNYQKKLDELIAYNQKNGIVPTLFLHACCAPCSSYCLEYLCKYFKITVFYYNPNISIESEYSKRVDEEKRLIEIYNEQIKSGEREGYTIDIKLGRYEPAEFFAIAKGYESCAEGGERCFRCYELRLRESAINATGYDYFATTLTISPLKNAQKLNEIGDSLSNEYGVKYLPSDFKKKNGFKRSVELSGEYNLYRQNFCGCVYSRTAEGKIPGSAE